MYNRPIDNYNNRVNFAEKLIQIDVFSASAMIEEAIRILHLYRK